MATAMVLIIAFIGGIGSGIGKTLTEKVLNAWSKSADEEQDDSGDQPKASA